MGFKPKSYTLLPQGELEPLTSKQTRRWNLRRVSQWVIPCVLAGVIILALVVNQITRNGDDKIPAPKGEACPQYPALEATSEKQRALENDLEDELSSEDFFNKSLKRMQGAIQIATESFDDMGEVGEDHRWDVFIGFQEYLEKTFPLVFSKLDVQKINTYGLLIEWKGKDDSLKPYLFMGHQDVVPVLQDTVSRWTYPPYSAHYDGRYIWGRGGSDCKNVVIGVLEAFETLLAKAFEPERTMLVSFGFDEEISGWHGAQFLADHILKTKGKNSLDLVLDEGGLGIQNLYGSKFILPGVGEKGYVDVRVTVETAGGHSSVPPDHSGIGILSRVVAAIEDKPYEPELTPVNPFFTTLQCGAEYGTEIDSGLQKAIKKALTSKSAAKSVANRLAKDDIRQRYLMQTSQAVDLVSGGVKVNALPEKVFAVVNHRVAVESSVKEVRTNLEKVITESILPKFSLSLDAWGSVSGNTSSTSFGQIILSDFDKPLDPSPVSPYDTDAFKTFTGTLKQVFGKEYIVAPSLMTGNTDTKFYWDLTKNIYRFSPVREEGRANAHTVDERIGMKEHIEGVKFYAQLVLNGDRK